MDKNILIQFTKEAYALTLFFPKKEPLRWRVREAADEMLSRYILKQNGWFQDLRAQLEIIDSYLEIAAGQNWMAAAKIIDLRMQAVQIGRDIEWEPRIAAPKIDLPESEAGPRKEECFHMPAAEKLTLKEGLPIGGGSPQAAPENKGAVAVKESEIIFQPAAVGQADPLAEPPVIEESDDEDEDDDEGSSAAAMPLTSGQVARQTRILEFLKEKGGAQVWEIQKIFPDISKRTIRRDFRSMLKQGIIERTGERNTIAYKLKVNLD